MQKNKINLKKENHIYELNINHHELIKPFNFLTSDIDDIMAGKANQTTMVAQRQNKEGYKITLKLFEYVEGLLKEEFQIELEISGETYQAFYSIDEEGYVYLTKYEYLNLIKIFEKMDYEVETNLMDLRVMGNDFLSNLLSVAFYKNETFDLKMEAEDFKKSYESIKTNKVVYYEDVLAQGLVNDKKIRIYDYEEDREYWVTIDMLQKGFEILQDKHPKEYSNIICDNYDLVDADMLIQCVLFGEVTYG